MSYSSGLSGRAHEDVEGGNEQKRTPARPSDVHLALYALFSSLFRPEQRQGTCKCEGTTSLLKHTLMISSTLQDVTPDSDESEDDQPRRKRVAHSKDPPSAIPPAPVDVIDLTEGDQGFQPNAPDNSAPIRQSERIGLETRSAASCLTYSTRAQACDYC